MLRKPTEYRCLLISPSDVEAEREALTQMVIGWNAHIGESLGTRVNLVRWESHSVPDSLAPAQKSLNTQIVDDSDFGIAIFWTRIGTETANDESGSAEEIRRLTEKGVRVLVYFSTAPVPQSLLTDDQFKRLQTFKEELSRHSLPGSYSNPEDLCQQLQLHLTSVVSGLLPKERGLPLAPSAVSVLTAPVPDVRVRVNTSLVMPADELIPMLQVAVQNHSPVVVYISSIYLMLEDGSRMTALRDAVTDARLYRGELQPGRSYGFFYSPKDILEAQKGSRVICAAASDDIGREYRSDEEEMMKVLRHLFPKSEAI